MFCTNCGKQMPDDSAFCTSCGSKLDSAPVNNPTPDQQTPSDEMTAMNDPSSVVPAEGNAPAESTPAVEAPVSTESTPAPATPSVSTSSGSPKKSGPSTLVVLIGAVVVIVLLVLLLGGGGSGYKDEKKLVTDYLTAISKNDYNALLKLYDKDAQKDMKEDKEDIKEALEEAQDDFKDRYGKNWIKDVEKIKKSKVDTDDGVTYYTATAEIDGKSFSVGIKKVKDKYYIDEDRDHVN
jgi:uncharacterized membrane protein YvbJ